MRKHLHPLSKSYKSELPTSKSGHRRLVGYTILALQRQAWILGAITMMSSMYSSRLIHNIVIEWWDFWSAQIGGIGIREITIYSYQVIHHFISMHSNMGRNPLEIHKVTLTNSDNVKMIFRSVSFIILGHFLKYWMELLLSGRVLQTVRKYSDLN